MPINRDDKTPTRLMPLIESCGCSRLYDSVIEVLRVRHYSRRAGEAYVHWIRRYIDFYHHWHPLDRWSRTGP